MRVLGAALGLTFALALALSQSASADGIDRTYEVGAQPGTIAIDPSDGRLYVVNRGSSPGFISVIDPASGQITSHPTSGTPTTLALDAVHRRLYVSNFNQLFDVFDLRTMAIVATLPVYGLGIAVDTNTQRVYVAGGTTNVTVIDGATNTVADTKPTLPGQNWNSVALDPSLHRVYVANFTSDPYGYVPVYPSLVVLDDRDLSISNELRLPVQPRWALGVDEARHRVHVAGSTWDDRTGYVRRLVTFDGVSLSQIGSVDLSADPFGLAVGTDRIYVTSFLPGYYVLDAATLQMVETFATLPLQPFLPALDAQGRLYVGGRILGAADAVYAISPANHPPILRYAFIVPSAPTTLDVLTYSVSAMDGDFAEPPSGQRDPLTLTYEWARNGAVIPGETSSTFDLSRLGAGDRGDTITASVTVKDPEGLALSTSASIVVANAVPATTVSLSPATPRANEVLTANASAPDLDGDSVTLVYEWTRNGAVIAGATAASLNLAAHAQARDVIAVRVSGSDGHGGVGVATATAFVLPASGSFLYLKSQPGDYIGQGAEELYTPTDSFIDGSLPQGGSTFNARVIQGNYVDWWYVTIAAPIGQPLAVGAYTGAVRAAFRPAGTPGLDVSGNGRGCNELTGTFTVTALTFSSYGEIQLFDATFEQHCEGGTTALFGRIRLEIPPPTPGVTLPAGSVSVPTSGTFLYMNQPNTTGGTYEQLYTSADSTFSPSFTEGANLFYASVIQGSYVHWWYVNIAAPLGQPLTVGSYVHAVRAMSRTAVSPGLDVSGDGQGCNEIKGKFDVDELTFAPTGELLVFQATFEQWCDASFTARYGRIRIQNAPPPLPPVILGVTLREEGSANSKSGVATISGTVSCSRGASVEVGGTLTQQVTKRLTVVGAFSTTVACIAPSVAWSATVTGEGGKFGPGEATATLTATACEPQCVHADATRTVKLNSSK